jgi:hypothetical protein
MLDDLIPGEFNLDNLLLVLDAKNPIVVDGFKKNGFLGDLLE